MKIRKTRIKKTTKANGVVYFIAEYKWGFWWYQFNDMMSPVAEPWLIYFNWIDEYKIEKCNFEYTEQQARDLIDYYIKRMKYKAACAIENEIVKVEFEKYL